MIVDVDDLKLLCKQFNIPINLTDEEIKHLIQIQLDSILAQLGVSLDPTIHNYTVYNVPPKKPIVLPLPDIVGVDHIIVNNEHLCNNEYFFDDLNGIVHITKNFGCCPLRSVHINYITKLSDLFIEKLKSLLLDTLLLLLVPFDDDNGIKSIKEGDVTVTYDDDWGWYSGMAKAIPIKLKELESLLYRDTTIMIG